MELAAHGFARFQPQVGEGSASFFLDGAFPKTPCAHIVGPYMGTVRPKYLLYIGFPGSLTFQHVFLMFLAGFHLGSMVLELLLLERRLSSRV